MGGVGVVGHLYAQPSASTRNQKVTDQDAFARSVPLHPRFVCRVPNRSRRPSRTARATFYSTLQPPKSTLCSGGGERRCALGLAGPCPRMPINARSCRETCTNSLFSFRRPLRLPPRCAVGTRGAAVGKSTGGVALRHPRYGVRVVSQAQVRGTLPAQATDTFLRSRAFRECLRTRPRRCL